MAIVPLPVYEADADPSHRDALTLEEQHARIEAPTSVVVRFGRMKLVGEFPYSGDVHPGCGSKLVARTHRGTELVEMLTSTCPNAGCSKSVTRQEMLEYIDASGGRDYPFGTKGAILRIATIEDLECQSALEEDRQHAVRVAKAAIRELALPISLVDAEPILGGEVLTFYYMAEERIDLRDLSQRLAGELGTRVDLRQVGARDEARLVADYERCGQHCCCKNFLKVLKPVSLSSAKRQKATLEPLKISGRCGRLMCCLRYEDQTYKDLKANLPHRKSRVGTPHGPGIVVDTKLLVQLVLVRLEHDDSEMAIPVEELLDPDECPQPGTAVPDGDPLRGMEPDEAAQRSKRRRRRRKRSGRDDQQAFRESAEAVEDDGGDVAADAGTETGSPGDGGEGGPKRRRRRKRRSGGGPGGRTEGAGPGEDRSGDDGSNQRSDGTSGRSRRRRRRRRRRDGGDSGGSDGRSGGGSGDG